MTVKINEVKADIQKSNPSVHMINVPKSFLKSEQRKFLLEYQIKFLNPMKWKFNLFLHMFSLVNPTPNPFFMKVSFISETFGTRISTKKVNPAVICRYMPKVEILFKAAASLYKNTDNFPDDLDKPSSLGTVKKTWDLVIPPGGIFLMLLTELEIERIISFANIAPRGRGIRRFDRKAGLPQRLKDSPHSFRGTLSSHGVEGVNCRTRDATGGSPSP